MYRHFFVCMLIPANKHAYITAADDKEFLRFCAEKPPVFYENCCFIKQISPFFRMHKEPLYHY